MVSKNPELSLNQDDAVASDLHQQRSALIASREFFHAIVNDSGDGIIVLTGNGLICFANPAAGLMLGSEPDELLGANFGIPIIPGKVTEIELVKGDKSAHIAEMRVVATNWQSQPAYLATLRDITAHKQAEKDALRAVRRRDRFLAMLSHELRTPLAAIYNASQVLVRKVDDLEDDSGFSDLTDVLMRQCDQMTILLDDLLNVSRISRGQLRLRRAPLDILDVVKNAAESVSPAVQEKSHHFQLELPEGPVIVDADAVRLNQVISNLLTNAVKYTDDGGWIRLSIELEQDSLLLRVQDDGIGIEPSMMTRVFEPFVRATSSLESLEGGLGVGLALVRDLVALHGGKTHIASDGQGKGSTFTVELPLATAEQVEKFMNERKLQRLADQEHHDESAHASTIEKPTVLLVEDQQDVRNMLRTVLELEGFNVQTASDGHEAIEILDVHRPDVALVDIGLPIIDGYQVARHVRANYGQNVYLIALTGYGQEADIRLAQSAGFDRHLTKPVNCDRLIQIMCQRSRV